MDEKCHSALLTALLAARARLVRFRASSRYSPRPTANRFPPQSEPSAAIPAPRDSSYRALQQTREARARSWSAEIIVHVESSVPARVIEVSYTRSTLEGLYAVGRGRGPEAQVLSSRGRNRRLRFLTLGVLNTRPELVPHHPAETLPSLVTASVAARDLGEC